MLSFKLVQLFKINQQKMFLCGHKSVKVHVITCSSSNYSQHKFHYQQFPLALLPVCPLHVYLWRREVQKEVFLLREKGRQIDDFKGSVKLFCDLLDIFSQLQNIQLNRFINGTPWYMAKTCATGFQNLGCYAAKSTFYFIEEPIV